MTAAPGVTAGATISVKVRLAMEEYRRRLEHTQLKIYAALLVLLFGGLLILPWIGQVIWIAFIMAIYIRLTHVITRKEELLEELHPRRGPTKCSAWSELGRRRGGISDFWDLRVDANPRNRIVIKPTPVEKRITPSAQKTHRLITFDQ
jgi:hypothetical protein